MTHTGFANFSLSGSLKQCAALLPPRIYEGGGAQRRGGVYRKKHELPQSKLPKIGNFASPLINEGAKNAPHPRRCRPVGPTTKLPDKPQLIQLQKYRLCRYGTGGLVHYS